MGRLPVGYVPSGISIRDCDLWIVFDNCKVNVKIGKKTVYMELWDTSGEYFIQDLSA